MSLIWSSDLTFGMDFFNNHFKNEWQPTSIVSGINEGGMAIMQRWKINSIRIFVLTIPNHNEDHASSVNFSFLKKISNETPDQIYNLDTFLRHYGRSACFLSASRFLKFLMGAKK